MNLGINVVEVNGRATPSIQGAATSVAAILVDSQRGVANVVRRVTSFAQYLGYFGDYTAGSYAAYAVRGFFDNGGGVAYVARLGRNGATAASHAFLDAGNANIFTLSAGYLGADDAGSWANGATVNGKTVGLWVKIEASATANYFKITVLLGDRAVEVWDKLKIGGTSGESPAKLNDEFTGSRYIKVTLGTSTSQPTTSSAAVALTGAVDGSALGDAEYNSATGGFHLFDGYDVQLLACPETSDVTIAGHAMDYCEQRNDCMFVGHLPDNYTTAQATAYGNGSTMAADKRYGALYYPWIKVADPLGTTRWVPPTGHVLGVYARTDRERGIWKAPAGNEARLLGALDTHASLSDADLTGLVKDGHVNGIRYIAGLGIVIDSSRTLSTNALWLYVNVRLLFNFVKTSLKQGLRWVVQEPNDDRLWNKVKYNSVNPFLTGLWRRGALGPGKPEEVFSVKVDADNNPPASIQQGILNIEVYLYPSRPAETVVITVGQQEGGATTGERG